jgi:hypothetical protein
VAFSPFGESILHLEKTPRCNESRRLRGYGFELVSEWRVLNSPAIRKLLKISIVQIGLRFAFIRANFETEKFLAFETETANSKGDFYERLECSSN